MAPGRKIERISSTATEMRGYPTISQEMRFVGGKEPIYMSEVTMFVKSALVDIASFSPSRETARRNRDLFVNGRDQIVAFLTQKWARELEYRLIKEVWTQGGNRIAVRFVYESHDTGGQWFRSHGNENWQFTDLGLMEQRHASINDRPIHDSERLFHWPLGPRPATHPGLTELGL